MIYIVGYIQMMKTLLNHYVISMDEIRFQLNKLVKFSQLQRRFQQHNILEMEQNILHILMSHQMSKRKQQNRKLTCLMYFNLFENAMYDTNKYDECSRIYLRNHNYKDIEPISGRMIVFNSQWLPLQVLPSYFNRHAVTLWLY